MKLIENGAFQIIAFEILGMDRHDGRDLTQLFDLAQLQPQRIGIVAGDDFERRLDHLAGGEVPQVQDEVGADVADRRRDVEQEALESDADAAPAKPVLEIEQADDRLAFGEIVDRDEIGGARDRLRIGAQARIALARVVLADDGQDQIRRSDVALVDADVADAVLDDQLAPFGKRDGRAGDVDRIQEEEGLRGVADTVITLSKSEGLPAHGEAISARTNTARTNGTEG